MVASTGSAFSIFSKKESKPMKSNEQTRWTNPIRGKKIRETILGFFKLHNSLRESSKCSYVSHLSHLILAKYPFN